MLEEERKQICKIAEKKFLKTFSDSYEESIRVFYECYKNTALLADRVSDGEIIDQVYLKENVQKVIYAYRNAQRKKKERNGESILNPENISVPEDFVEASIMENKAMGEFALTGSLSEYETGMWLKCLLND